MTRCADTGRVPPASGVIVSAAAFPAGLRTVRMAIVETTVTNSVLTVRNPEGTAAALTITPLAGGTRPVSAHLVITQIG